MFVYSEHLHRILNDKPNAVEEVSCLCACGCGRPEYILVGPLSHFPPRAQQKRSIHVDKFTVFSVLSHQPAISRDFIFHFSLVLHKLHHDLFNKSVTFSCFPFMKLFKLRYKVSNQTSWGTDPKQWQACHQYLRAVYLRVCQCVYNRLAACGGGR